MKKMQTVHLMRFRSGNQGLLCGVATLRRVVHVVRATVVPFSCAQEPLRKQTVHWIWYAGQRYPLRREKLGDGTIGWALALSSTAPKCKEELEHERLQRAA